MAGVRPLEDYTASLTAGYSLLPLRFHRLQSGNVFVSNLVGEWEILAPEIFSAFVDGSLTFDTPEYADLKAKHFLLDQDSTVAVDLLGVKLQRPLSHLSHVFGLPIRLEERRVGKECVRTY